jgi:hypothetical protein
VLPLNARTKAGSARSVARTNRRDIMSVNSLMRLICQVPAVFAGLAATLGEAFIWSLLRRFCPSISRPRPGMRPLNRDEAAAAKLVRVGDSMRDR